MYDEANHDIHFQPPHQIFFHHSFEPLVMYLLALAFNAISLLLVMMLLSYVSLYLLYSCVSVLHCVGQDEGNKIGREGFSFFSIHVATQSLFKSLSVYSLHCIQYQGSPGMVRKVRHEAECQ